MDKLSSHNDPKVHNIAENSVGLKPSCKMFSTMLEDEGVISTCHIGIGTSITLGKAPIHYNLPMWDSRIKLMLNLFLMDRKSLLVLISKLIDLLL